MSVPYNFNESENISNPLAAEFAAKLSANEIPVQTEMKKDFKGEIIARTRFCIRYENGICPGKNAEPLIMKDNKNTFRIEFDCEKCEMQIRLM